MSKRAGLLLFAAFAALFLTVNRDAYRGYFQDDEIDNLSWAPYLGPLDFLQGAGIEYLKGFCKDCCRPAVRRVSNDRIYRIFLKRNPACISLH